MLTALSAAAAAAAAAEVPCFQLDHRVAILSAGACIFYYTLYLAYIIC